MPFNSLPRTITTHWNRFISAARDDRYVNKDDRAYEINRLLLKRCQDIPIVAQEARRKQDISISIAAICLAAFASYSIIIDGVEAQDPPSGPIIDGCQVSNGETQISLVNTPVMTSQDIIEIVAENVFVSCSPNSTEQIIAKYNPDKVMLSPSQDLYLNTPGDAVITLQVPRIMEPASTS